MVQRKGRWREKEQICGVELLLGMPELLCPVLPPWAETLENSVGWGRAQGCHTGALMQPSR